MQNQLTHVFTMLGIMTCLSASCSSQEKEQKTEQEDVPNQLTAQEKKEGWQLLFDGKSMQGWHLYNRGEAPSAWIVQNGELYCQPGLSYKNLF